MNPRFADFTSKKFVGMRMRMSLVNNKTGQLWGSFMPRLKEISNNLSSDLYSLNVYEPDHFRQFNPSREFEKWALAEVSNFDIVPQGMETFICEGGMYAVFDYKGSSHDTAIFQYIFGTWLPQSTYLLDNRPHFEVLGPKYRTGDPESEEEIWIPIRSR